MGVFNATQVTQIVLDLDPTRLVDTNSGGPANSLYFADVNGIPSENESVNKNGLFNSICRCPHLPLAWKSSTL